jgi:membrane protein CcdC involved in cytochrome C biogenesis
MLLVTILFVNYELQGPLFNTIILFGGGILGVILGMVIASLTKLKLDKKGNLLMRGSFIAMGLWFLIIVAKLYGQDTLNQMGLSSDLILSLFLMISVSTMISERVFIYYRYLRNRKEWKKAQK